MAVTCRSARHAIIAIALLSTLSAPAATMLGTVLRDGQPPRPGLQLTQSCGDKSEATATTDAQGDHKASTLELNASYADSPAQGLPVLHQRRLSVAVDCKDALQQRLQVIVTDRTTLRQGQAARGRRDVTAGDATAGG